MEFWAPIDGGRNFILPGVGVKYIAEVSRRTVGETSLTRTVWYV